VEEATAPKGHQLCANCHEPHSGEHLAKATCASCHENKTTGPHATVAGGCPTCHRPHGAAKVNLGPAAPPACATCHDVKELPALHSIPAHAACANCHSSHDGPRADRATCTSSCHTDRKTHQPQAPVCSGCHVFRR
jgi:predicted CXXCH cytochrome family protein